MIQLITSLVYDLFVNHFILSHSSSLNGQFYVRKIEHSLRRRCVKLAHRGKIVRLRINVKMRFARSEFSGEINYARLTYAAVTKTSHGLRINSVIDRARRLGYCSPDLPTFDELCDIADDELFGNVLLWSSHVLHTLLQSPSTASQRYNLRHRAQTRMLPEHPTLL